MSEFISILKKKMGIIVVTIIVCIAGAIGFVLLKHEKTVTSKSLFSYDYSSLLSSVNNYSNISDLQYRKTADYVAIANSENFKKSIVSDEKESITIKVTLLRDSHIGQLAITGGDESTVKKYEVAVQQKIAQIANDMYKDKIISISQPTIEINTLNRSQFIRFGVLGLIAGIILSFVYTMTLYIKAIKK